MKESNFVEYRNQLLQELVFVDPLNNDNMAIVNQIQSCPSCSIHVRRGDYLNNINNKIFASCSPEYYQQAIQIIRESVSNPIFYFFSDDIPWCKKTFKDLNNTYFVDINHGKNSYNDMRLMSLCQHNIIPNSSFSWWGAWLNQNPDKIVIAPRNYLRDQVQNEKTIHQLMPQNWILI